MKGECREKESEPGSLATKGKFIRGKREGDWLLRRTSVFPFWWSPSYTPLMKNSLKGWSRSQRSGIWWSRSFEKIGTSEITGCHLGNLVSLKDHWFILCKVDITTHLINETPCGSYHWPPKNWWFPIAVLEKAIESPLDSKEIKLVNIEGNKPWIFIGRTDAEAKAPLCE